jgi:hypothetical protein
LLSKFGIKPLKNIWIYDTWWRLIRNMQITSIQELNRFTGSYKWPPLIEKIVTYQSKLKRSWLKIGLLSKLFMVICYVKSSASSTNIFEDIE